MDLTPFIFLAFLGFMAMIYIFSQQSNMGKKYRELTEEIERKRTPLRTFTVEEVAQHNSRFDAWIIVRHKGTQQLRVYDISTYIEDHPGGDSILRNVGKDSTLGFHGPQHPVSVYDLIEEYVIGVIEE